MLVMREEQLEILSKYALDEFENRMIPHLRSRFKEQLLPMDDSKLRSLIRHGIAKAKQYDIAEEFDVRRYLEYMLEYGPDFDTSPSTSWAHQILMTQGATGAKKMDRLDNYTTFVLRV
jgi:hypothetical protein